MGDILYEPRALWQVFSVDSADYAETDTPVVKGTREFWRNGSRFPVVITRISMAAINYLLSEQDDTAADITTWNNCAAVLSKFKVEIAAPYRQRFMPRRVRPFTFSPSANWQSTRYDPASYAGALYGAYFKRFDMPLVVARHGVLEFGLTGWTRHAAPIMGATDFPYFSYGFHQATRGKLNGYTRVTEREQLLDARTAGVYPAGPQPFVGDGFVQSGGIQASAAASDQAFPVQHKFSPSDFKFQDSNRGTAADEYYGLSVLIDQIDVDEDIQGGPQAAQFLSPMGLNVGCFAKTTSGGTGQDWWRRGAPLALVLNDITPALVYDLPEPVTLRPGDALEVFIETPSSRTIGQALVEPVYNFGVAASGYAIIEA